MALPFRDDRHIQRANREHDLAAMPPARIIDASVVALLISEQAYADSALARIDAACRESWNKLTAERLQSHTHTNREHSSCVLQPKLGRSGRPQCEGGVRRLPVIHRGRRSLRSLCPGLNGVSGQEQCSRFVSHRLVHARDLTGIGIRPTINPAMINRARNGGHGTAACHGKLC